MHPLTDRIGQYHPSNPRNHFVSSHVLYSVNPTALPHQSSFSSRIVHPVDDLPLWCTVQACLLPHCPGAPTCPIQSSFAGFGQVQDRQRTTHASSTPTWRQPPTGLEDGQAGDGHSSLEPAGGRPELAELVEIHRTHQEELPLPEDLPSIQLQSPYPIANPAGPNCDFNEAHHRIRQVAGACQKTEVIPARWPSAGPICRYLARPM